MNMLLQNANIGKVLRDLRMEKKFSQQKLVDAMNLMGSTTSRSTYSKIEMGLGNLKFTDLVILKQVLNVDYDDFFFEFVGRSTKLSCSCYNSNQKS